MVGVYHAFTLDDRQKYPRWLSGPALDFLPSSHKIGIDRTEIGFLATFSTELRFMRNDGTVPECMNSKGSFRSNVEDGISS
jgi:hypothetical protein